MKRICLWVVNLLLGAALLVTAVVSWSTLGPYCCNRRAAMRTAPGIVTSHDWPLAQPELMKREVSWAGPESVYTYTPSLGQTVTLPPPKAGYTIYRVKPRGDKIQVTWKSALPESPDERKWVVKTEIRCLFQTPAFLGWGILNVIFWQKRRKKRKAEVQQE